jgi:hypothetical protein
MALVERFQNRGSIYRSLPSRGRSQIRKAQDYYQFGKSAFSHYDSPPFTGCAFILLLFLDKKG